MKTPKKKKNEKHISFSMQDEITRMKARARDKLRVAMFGNKRVHTGRSSY